MTRSDAGVVSLLIGVGLFFAAGSAVAQVAGVSPVGPAATVPAPTSAPAGAEAGSDIIVTARKRSERLINVPVAISALSKEQIDRYATATLTTISQQVPQLVIAETQNQVGGSINLRGIGAGISNPSTETAVTLNIDGVPISYGNAIRLGQIDLGRVEVLKGPQALFYGKNSPGGIISLISEDPGKTFDAKLRTGYEFYAAQRYVEASASGPVSDTVGVRLVGYYSAEDGWFQNIAVPIANVTPGAAASTLNAEDVFVRGTVKYDAPGGTTHFKIKVNYGERNRSGVGPTGLTQIVYCPGGTSRFGATNCTLDRYFYSEIIPAKTTALDPTLGDGVPFSRSRQFLTSLSIDQDLGSDLTLSSVTGYYSLGEKSIDPFTFSNNPYFAASDDLVARGFSQELRVASNFSGRFNFLYGGFFQDAHFDIRQAFGVNLGTPFLVGSTFYNVHTTAASAFAQARYKLLDTLELAAGGRYSTERKGLTGTSFGSPIDVASPVRHYHDFSPEVTLTYRPTADLTAYAAYREGFTSGGFNTAPTALRSAANQALARIDLSYGQETARGGDLGLKGYLAARQVTYDIDAYYYKYDGLQLSRYDNASFTQLTQNAGGADIKGIEGSFTYRPRGLLGLSLNTSIAYNHARYTNFIGGCYAGQSIAAGCNLNPKTPTLPASTCGTAANPYQNQNQTGQQLVRAPEVALTAGFVYDRAVNDRLGISFALDTNYSGSYVTQTEGDPFARQNAYWQLNGAVSLNAGRDKPWELALIGRNLTNKLIVVAGSVVGATATGTGTASVVAGDILGGVGPPRTVLLQLTVRNSFFGRR